MKQLEEFKPRRDSGSEGRERPLNTVKSSWTGVTAWVEENLELVVDELGDLGNFGLEKADVDGLLENLRGAILSAGTENLIVPTDFAIGGVCQLAAIDILRQRLLATWPVEETESVAARLSVMNTLERLRSEATRGRDAGLLSPFSAGSGGELVVQLAHDLRSPLTSILFLAETLGRGQSGELNELQHRQLGLIYSAALGLASISGDVINLAKGGEGLVEAEPTPFSIGEIFASVRNMVSPLADEKGLELKLNHSVSDHWKGHPLALSRVLLNLTTNALKFTEDGFVEIGVRATGLTSLEFWVKDTGPGIASHSRRDLFKMFRTVPRHGRAHFSGTGLGLHICRSLVSQMESELRYETAADSGTRFYFELKVGSAARI